MPPDGSPWVLSLDLWHTLVYLEPEAEEAYMRAQVDLATEVLLSSPQRPGTPARDRPAIRTAFEAVYSEAVAASQRGESVGPSRQIDLAGARVGRLPDPQQYLDGLAALVARTPFTAAPEASAVVAALRTAGWRTALVSNTVGEPGASLLPVVERLGFRSLIDAFVFSDEGRWTKPSPQIFLEAIQRLAGSPERTVHVGDGWVDIEGARRAGLRAGILYTGLQHYGQQYRRLFLPPDWGNPDTPFRFERWPELPGILDRVG